MEETTFGSLQSGMTYIVQRNPQLLLFEEIVILKKLKKVTLVHYNPNSNGSKRWEHNDTSVGTVIDSFQTDEDKFSRIDS